MTETDAVLLLLPMLLQVTPDIAVQYEALIAGIGQRQLYSLAEIGLAIQRQLADIGAGPVTTLRLVLDMLFPDAAGRQAAAAIEQCVLVSYMQSFLYFQCATSSQTS